ncbi:unnamed protein product [Cylicocyclus nassatus]|uniref:G-protein coupled receptors family 1 profile domain-containing protein n=1 Tax=Cylicocyclus nassatus TaxID=53992 RepID=A0AA36H3P5_CYLNA|nr:unnamed protein product [Cylicocyclus nassatus]
MSCKVWYVFSHVWLAATFAVIVAALSLSSSSSEEVVCIVTAALRGQVSDIVFDGALVANVLILVCYGLFLRGVRRITIKRKNMTVYRPLILISISVILGWITIISFGVISMLIRLDINNLDVVLVAGLPINLSMAGNFFVYYAVSKQYRKLFDAHLRIRAVKNFLGLREAKPQKGTLFVTNFQR